MMRNLHRLYRRSWIESRLAAALAASAAMASSAALLCAALNVANFWAIVAASAFVGAIVSARTMQFVTYSESEGALLLLALNLSITAAYLILV